MINTNLKSSCPQYVACGLNDRVNLSLSALSGRKQHTVGKVNRIIKKVKK